jgi:acyl-CoA synthetase (NDP forming)
MLVAMRDLSRLLRPTTIAVVGGGAWCEQIILQCQKMKFAGHVWMVHPREIEVCGVKAVASLAALPSAPDAVFLGVNRHLAIELMRELSLMGAGGAVCFASGFSEAIAEDASGADLQAALIDAAGEMPFLGPNCYGYVNALDSALLWPDQHGCTPVETGVAILTQSSNIAINLTMQQRGLPIAYTIACGNMAQTSQAQIATSLLDDPRVTAIGLHIEGFSDIAEWAELARKAHKRGVPLIALKVGKSDQAQRATVSHTASLAGSDAGADALLRHLGIGRVYDLPAFLETLMVLHCNGRLDAPTLSSVSCSGGEASLIADLAHDTLMTFPTLTEGQKIELSGALGPMVALSNPLDYNTYIWRDTEAMTRAWLPMTAPHIGMTMLIVDYPHTDASDWVCATDAAIAIREKSGRPVAVVATLPELMPLNIAQKLLAAGVTPLKGLREAVAAAEIASSTVVSFADVPLPAGVDRDAIVLNESDAKAALASYGMRVPQQAADVEAAGALAEPFAVKGTGFAHKSEVGAVALNVSHAELAKVVKTMPSECVLIEEMITGSVAEMLIGVVRDPAHGFILTIGAGGVLTEIMQDAISFIVPTRAEVIRAVLPRLKTYLLLSGFRGAAAANVDELIDGIMALQSYVIAHADRLEEVEINPMMCTPTHAIAADALIRIAPKGPDL